MTPRRVRMPDAQDAWLLAAERLVAKGRAPETLDLVPEGLAQLGLFEEPGQEALGAVNAPSGNFDDRLRCGHRRSKRPVVALGVAQADFRRLLRRLLAAEVDDRHALAYRLWWRLVRGEAALLDDPLDPDVRRAREVETAVRRDAHKTKAFVRFRFLLERGVYVAFHRPDHRVLPLVRAFFVDRFGSQRFSILTPQESLHWDGRSARLGPGAPAHSAPSDDALEALWLTYYASTFNPARVKPKAMRKEMPVRHWRTLPETALIPGLLREAPARVERMVAAQRSVGVSTLPASDEAGEGRTEVRSIVDLSAALAQCDACPRRCSGARPVERSARAVPGEGPVAPRLILVGEQPGDAEDTALRPFIGPAGEVLTRALAAAGLAREEVWLTNAVRHFHFTAPGPGPLPKPPRLHQRPSAAVIERCRPWLELELELLAPAPVLCLGATAAFSVLGRRVPVEASRGRDRLGLGGRLARVTYHPSAALRAATSADAHRIRAALAEDIAALSDCSLSVNSTFV